MARARIPFDMFDVARSAEDARRMVKLANLYHRGQDLAWDGRAVLGELLQKHGGIKLAPDKRRAMAELFGVIMWGELAAWKISAELADGLVDLEPKMAATSQAHDEARHFYVMYDYLRELGEVPRGMDRSSRAMLELVMSTRSLAEKILGMQLMVETTALTIFQATREARLEPVLADLLRYYEKDEARHVGLGVQLLPQMFARMGRLEGLKLFSFQMRVLAWSLASLKSLAPSLVQLGLDPRQILELGRAKQVIAFNQLWEQMGVTEMPRAREWVFRGVNAVCEVLFPRGEKPEGLRATVRAMRHGWRTFGEGIQDASLSPDEPARPVAMFRS
jgi:hypothetical protein